MRFELAHFRPEVGAAAAAPPCASFSRARLRPGGPPPVRTVQSCLHSRARHFLSLVAAHGGLSSLRTHPPACFGWTPLSVPGCQCTPPSAHTFLPASSACRWLKPGCNHDVLSSLGCRCPHPPGFHSSFAGKRNSDPSFATRQTACYPQPLATAIASCIQPFLSLLPDPIKLPDWRHLLPPAFLWPAPGPRIEDGAGTSAALCLFESDLRFFFRVESDDTWAKLMAVDAGQPFRLNLWHCLSVICCDPDMDLFRILRDGVPLGIGSPIPPCKVLFPPESPDASVIPLQRCDSAWKSALDHADLVDDLLATELQEGWIRPIPGGDAKLSCRYRHTAVGKLGVVVSSDRPPRLVVDSSVSGVTSNTHLPNKAPNPSLADVRKCLPLCPANESLAALVLDVSKAHRRVRIRPEDQGLLCFRHRGALYQSVTLNFGARASGFYWNRVAGLLLRLTYRLWRVRHSAQIYVDDLLAILLRSSAPLLSALLVVMLCVLRVPMSWHKAALSARVTWIGWSFDLETYTVELDPAKLRRLLELLRLLSASPRCTVSALEKLTGKLLWLSNLFQAFRPSLAPLYVDQHRPVPNMCAISADLCASLRSSLSADLLVTSSLPLAAIPVGCRLLRVAHTPVTPVATFREVPEHISSRRVWVPLRPERELSPESLEVIGMWTALASSPQPFRSLFYRPLLVCEAFADACADSASAGLGGFVRLPDGRQACFAQTLSASLLSDLFPWFPPDTSPQHCIAVWEMLAQVALLWILSRLLPPGHAPFHVVFRTDNSPSQSAAWKGLTLARGMCQFLRQFCLLQESA